MFGKVILGEKDHPGDLGQVTELIVFEWKQK